MFKYQVPNQLTGVSEEANTWEEAKLLKQKLMNEYLKYVDSLYNITVLIQNEDGSWLQSLTDEKGHAIPDWIPE